MADTAVQMKQKLLEKLDAAGKDKLDDSVLDYVCSILEATTDDIDEATDTIMPFFLDTGAMQTREQVHDMVEYVTGKSLSRSNTPENASNVIGAHTGMRHTLQKLAAPVKISDSAPTDPNADWADYMQKQGNPTYVDAEAVRKAEEKMRERQDKKAAKEAMRAATKREREGLNNNEAFATNYSGMVHKDAIEGRDDEFGLSPDIRVENLTVAYGKLELLNNTTLAINSGKRYGLIGRNGSGKSTLLRHISRREVPFSKRITVMHVEQEVNGTETTVINAVLSADIERTKLMEEEKRLLNAGNTSSDTRLKAIYQRMTEIDAFGAEARASAILSGLSFSEEDKQRPTKEFSGGWRMRIALARALFCQPDLLLLDEPTNHLDFHAVVWLERFLLDWKNTLVIVSHQRDFLNTVVTDIMFLHNHKLEYYKGNYDTFEKTANDRIKSQKAEYDAQLVQRKHIQKFIDRFRFNAKRASLVQSRIKTIEKMGSVDAVIEEGAVVLPFFEPEPVTPPILQWDEVSFAYPGGQNLFHNVSLNIDVDSRIALVGSNGCGKTTLLKLLMGELQPTAGHITKSGKVRVGHFSQHFVDQLELGISPVEHMQKMFPGMSSQDARAHLGKYGITGDTALQTLNTLSGGQKSRVVFAHIAYRRPHILLLDEPSNHLDIETIEGLAQSLTAFQGGVMIITHDQRLISMVADEIWQVADSSVKKWDGDVSSYKKWLMSQMKL